MTATDVDVLIVGGAVMGSATAYHLKRLDPAVDVVVVERDPTYERASSTLSDGNVRVQFNLEENIRISQFALEVLASFGDDMATSDYRPEVAARHQGNLFLSGEAAQDEARAGLRRQVELGCDVAWLDREEIVREWPPYAGPHYVGGTLGRRDGSFDPGAVIHGYRRKAIQLGVEYLEDSVARLLRRNGSVDGAELAFAGTVTAPVVVVCAGAWSSDLLAGIGVDVPVEPVMRNVFVVVTELDGYGEMPSAFLPSGLYVMPESAGTFLVGWSQDDDPIGFDFVVRRSRFYDLIWPELVDQFPAFDRLEVTGSWAGLYAVNRFDGNAIIGEWPEVTGLHVCTGFSGHGFQQCHAVGRHLAETILGETPSLDLSRLGPERIMRGEPLHESAGRLI